MFKQLWKKFGPNPLDHLLKKAAKRGCKTVLIPWNRGMGDIALGLYAIVHQVRLMIPSAKITFITRPDLEEPFKLLTGVDVIIDPSWKRGAPFTLSPSLPSFDLILDRADPSHWVAWQKGTLVPKLEWNPLWDDLHLRFGLPERCIGAHVSCETNYYFERNWPVEKWQELFSSIEQPIVLFGLKKEPTFSHPHLYDLRGETSILEILSIIKNRCLSLIAPDSGVLGLTYFLNISFPIQVVSLWADPNHGILKQNVPSPNTLLKHTAVISPDRKNAALIAPDAVRKALVQSSKDSSMKEQILKRLQEIKQPHLGAQLDQLSIAQQEQFLHSLAPDLLKIQQGKLKQKLSPQTFNPVRSAETASDQWLPLGIEQITQRKVACLILAGGQGSRLGSSLPKALIAVTPGTGQTLLELHLGKISAASIFHQTKIPCAIITSPENHTQIFQFLKERQFCGLDPDLVSLVMQNEAPFLDEQGNWFLREAGKLASGPDGNGHALHLLQSQGVLKQWKKQGIEEITIVPIDNPLADPVDPILIGYHASHPADVTLKVVQRQNAEEKVGVIVQKEGLIAVQEYTELPPNQEEQACLAHIGLFALNLSFAERVSQTEFPWHFALKQDRLTGQRVWKFERFIFDMLTHSPKTNLLLYPREDVYAPLKNATGDKSLVTVQEALQKFLAKRSR